MKKLKYACIGAGGIARKKHLPGYRKESDRVEIVAVCDAYSSAAEALAQDFGVPRVYTDYRDLLEMEKPDIISVCTPNCTHAEITIAALEIDCNVHVEKPIAINAEETRRIIEAEKKSKAQVMVGLNKRFLGQSYLIQRLIGEGFFGEIYRARCGWERNSGIPGTGRWFTDKAMSGGGALIDLGVHYLDLALSLMSWPKAVSVGGSIYSKFGPESERIRRGYKSNANGVYDVEDMATGYIRLENGALLDFEFSWASNIEKEVRYVELMGTEGGFLVEDDDFKLFKQFGGTMFTLHPDVKTMPEDVSECDHFVTCILESGTQVITFAEQALQVMKIIDGLYESAKENREIILE